MPISSNNSEKNDFVKKHLKSNFIVCNIKLISTAESKPDFSYISLDDKLLNSKLRSEITLDSNSTSEFEYFTMIDFLIEHFQIRL